MWIAELWRYPVKSMAGEPLQRAEITLNGIVGDRVVHVRDAGGRVITARSRPALLGHKAVLGPDGEPLVDGRPWRSAAVGSDVRAAAHDDTAGLHRWDGPERFDVLPLLVATDGSIEAFGHDRRRLRPNIVVGGVQGLAEREWEGRHMRLGNSPSPTTWGTVDLFGFGRFGCRGSSGTARKGAPNRHRSRRRSMPQLRSSFHRRSLPSLLHRIDRRKTAPSTPAAIQPRCSRFSTSAPE
jgi:hypothetical protein